MEDQETRMNGKMIIAVSRALQTIHKDSEALFRQNSLTMAQFAVLEALATKGDLTIGNLIDVVLSSSGNMTVVIRNLEKNGLIQKVQNKLDKRSYVIHLSDKGKVLIDDIFTKHMNLVRKKLEVLNEDEKELVIITLKKIG